MRLARRVTLFIRGTKMAPEKYQKSHNNQSALPLPLFIWADSLRRRKRPIAVAHVQRLYNVTPFRGPTLCGAGRLLNHGGGQG